MPNRTDIPEGGHIQHDGTTPWRESSLGFDLKKVNRTESEDKALHDAIAENIGVRRDQDSNDFIPAEIEVKNSKKTIDLRD